MAVDLDQYAALMRKQDARIKQLEKAHNDALSGLRSLSETIGALKAQAGPRRTFKEDIIARSHRSINFWYVQEITIAVGSTQRQPLVFTTDAKGWFFTERIWASYRPTGGGAMVNRWACLSNDNPMVVGLQGAAPPVTTGIDFYWEYSEGSTQMQRQTMPIPGGLLYRSDMDGIVPGSDGWAPSTTVMFHITPIIGPAQTGVFNLTVGGTQCINIEGMPVGS